MQPHQFSVQNWIWNIAVFFSPCWRIFIILAFWDQVFGCILQLCRMFTSLRCYNNLTIHLLGLGQFRFIVCYKSSLAVSPSFYSHPPEQVISPARFVLRIHHPGKRALKLSVAILWTVLCISGLPRSRYPYVWSLIFSSVLHMDTGAVANQPSCWGIQFLLGPIRSKFCLKLYALFCSNRVQEIYLPLDRCDPQPLFYLHSKDATGSTRGTEIHRLLMLHLTNNRRLTAY